MSSDKKIVFFDIDGTLYVRGQGMPESAVRALDLLKEKGHIPVICSGRPCASLPDEIMSLGFPAVIAGAGTWVECGGRVLQNIVLPNELLMRTAEKLRRAKCVFILEGPHYLSATEEEERVAFFSILQELRAKDPDLVQPQNLAENEACKMTVWLTDEAAFDAIVPELREDFELARYENRPLCELLPKNVSKASGIQILTEYLGIPHENTYAFGDGPNDVDMLQYVQYGIAMGNAEASVRKIAKYQTESLWEDGIYLGLKRFGLID